MSTTPPPKPIRRVIPIRPVETPVERDARIRALRKQITGSAEIPLGNDVLDRYRGRIRNRATAIRAFCMYCMGGYRKYVADCQSVDCALHGFRMGGDPHRKARAEARALAEQNGEAIPDDDAAEPDNDIDNEGEDDEQT